MQRLAGEPFRSAPAAVEQLLAVQSQDYAGAKWAVGQRVAGSTDAELDRAFDAGEIVRTHVLRPTWHFVAPADLRWLLELTKARVHQASAYQYRVLDIDAEVARRSAAVFERLLAGGQARTREELGLAMNDAGIPATGLRLTYLVMHAELEGVLVSGPRRGRRQTYALVEERVPTSRPRSGDEALAELGRRYVEGHGPAQAGDLAWWSGLTQAGGRRALEAASPPLVRETIDGRKFWVSPTAPTPTAPTPAAPTAPAPTPLSAGSRSAQGAPVVHLLPNYDELLIAFRDRTDAVDPGLPPPARVAQVILNHVVVRDGLVVGGWRRVEGKPAVRVELNLLVGLNDAERQALAEAIERFATFLGRAVETTGLD